MSRYPYLICLGILALAGAASAEEKTAVPVGTWKVAVLEGPSTEIAIAIVKMENADGKLKASLVAPAPFFKQAKEETKLGSATITDNQLKIVLDTPQGDWTIEATLPPRKDKSIAGSLSIGSLALPLLLVPTDMSELTEQNFKKASDPNLEPLYDLGNKAQQLGEKARQEKDAEKRSELLKKANEAIEEMSEKTPKLCQELLDKHPDSPAVRNCAMALIASAQKKKVDLEQLDKWVSAASKSAERFGPVIGLETRFQIAQSLAGNENARDYAVQYAQDLDKSLGPKDKLATRMRALKALQSALKKAGKTEEVKALDARIDKLDQQLDMEYLATMPPFEPEKFAGRKGKSKRAVVLELFTGAQCPPCVAADVGFDALEKTYKPSDVVLLQYHVHIPGPDPLTNSESVERFQYYGKAYPDDVGGTPTLIFNGKPAAGGGGPMVHGKAKYKEFRSVIDPLLEEKEGAELTGIATLQGNKIEIEAKVKGLKDAEDGKKRLRLILVEDTVHYVGGNGLRYHHQVVRSFPGGIDGFELKGADSKHKATVDVDELRKKLNDYLDEYAKGRAFPSDKRPLELKKLKVIALIQDDKTHEILQAVQMDPEVGADK